MGEELRGSLFVARGLGVDGQLCWSFSTRNGASGVLEDGGLLVLCAGWFAVVGHFLREPVREGRAVAIALVCLGARIHARDLDLVEQRAGFRAEGVPGPWSHFDQQTYGIGHLGAVLLSFALRGVIDAFFGRASFLRDRRRSSCVVGLDAAHSNFSTFDGSVLVFSLHVYRLDDPTWAE